MASTLRQTIQLITLCSLGALPSASLRASSPSLHPFVEATPAESVNIGARVAEVREVVMAIERDRRDLRQRIGHLETVLLKLEGALRSVHTDTADIALNWPEPRLVDTEVPSVAAPQIDVRATAADLPHATSATPDSAVEFAQTQPADVEAAQENTLKESALSDPPAATQDLSQTAAYRDEPPTDASTPLGRMLAISEATLGEMRAGFTTTSGLQINIGIERAVYINGDLVTLTTLNVANITADITSQATAMTQSILANAGVDVPATDSPPTTETITQTPTAATTQPAPIAQTTSATQIVPATTTTMPSPSVATTAAPIAEPTVTAAPLAATGVAQLPATTPTTGTSTGSSTEPSAAANVSQVQPATSVLPPSTSVSMLPSSNNGGGTLALIQSGTGNALGNIVVPAAVATVIQNSLDNQKIQNITVISATVNSLEVMKAINLQNTVNSAVIDSLKR